ncbi:MFS transporter [Aurantimonas sp. VKM B-3413]|uniref:MFS transporter n=1 Tax=Aurantimonas sp. VKM B-3413 TaxID=2779401 RepID=UPI001E3AC5B9|nr:MFS transporter [Aurantimonas sp. VKM B-3413]MCB8837901.1 MFS transporter [Aurantimonas sp. VKM B-3413]
MSDTTAPAGAVSAHGLSTAMTVLFAAACGALAANLYYAQPLVALIGDDIGLSRAAESSVVTFSQLGYACGLVLLVPLGDVIENRRLILLTMAANVASLVGLALAPGLATLFVMILVVGLTSCAAQMLVPLAANLAPDEERGRVVGNVMSGLLAGILFARPLASFLADYVGWRGVFGLSAGAITAMALAGLFVFPTRQPQTAERYGGLIASLGKLFLREPVLRRRGLYHAAMFAAFSLFWTGAPIILLRDPYDFSPSGVALFALAGVLGVFAAPVAGRLADRGHSRAGTITALAIVVLAFVAALFGENSLAALVAAGILIDLGVQANLVFGQREIYQLQPAIRNRLNAVYMTTFFLGGALGSALTSPVLEAFGWQAVCGIGIALPAAALAYFTLADRSV